MRLILALLLPHLASLVAGEASDPSTVVFPEQAEQQQQLPEPEEHPQRRLDTDMSAMNHTLTMPGSVMPAVMPAMMPEAKRMEMESWSPIMQEPPPPMHQPSYHPPAQPPPPPPPNNPPSYPPANYYLPGNQYNQYSQYQQYGPPPSTEFRSEHYGYPFDPNYYPISQPPIDTSLIPTSRHFVIVGFIGLLLLFAIIQNSITAARRKDALVEVLSSRRKRDIMASTDYESMSPELESALKEDARVRCIQRTLCYENRKLLDDLGIFGKLLAKYLTRSVQSSLKELSPGWDRLVEDAANAGLRGEDCNVVYRDCNFESSEEAVTEQEEE